MRYYPNENYRKAKKFVLTEAPNELTTEEIEKEENANNQTEVPTQNENSIKIEQEDNIDDEAGKLILNSIEFYIPNTNNSYQIIISINVINKQQLEKYVT